MKIQKKIWSITLCFALLFSLCACGKGNDNATAEKKDKTITIWAWDENFNIKAANAAKDMYVKDHPDVKVNVVSMAQNDIVQKLHTSLSSNNYEGLPNIVLIEDYKIQNFLTAYEGAFRPLDKIVNPDQFMDYKLKVMTKGDNIYGVPFDSGVAALFYRTDYLKDAGYTPDDMQNLTWEKYIEIAKNVKAKTGKDMLTLDPSDIGQIRMMLQSAGSWYVKEDGKTVDIENNQALKDAITIYKNLSTSGAVKTVSDWDSFVGAFQKGEVASVPTGCWIASSIAAASDQSGKWAVAALPRMGSYQNSINASSIGGASWYVLDKVGDSALAEDFLGKTFASSDELMNSLVKEINLVSTLKSSIHTENYKQPNAFFSNQKIFEDFSKWTTQVPTVNYGLHTYAIEDILTESVQAIVKGADMDTTLKNAQQQAQDAVID